MRGFAIAGMFLALLMAGCSKKTAPENLPVQAEAASLDDLNRALPVVVMLKHSFPPSTNDLAAFLKQSGKTMPVPPPGKKIVLDPAAKLFVIVNQ